MPRGGGAPVLARFRHLPLKALVLVLPYALYWLMARAIQAYLELGWKGYAVRKR